MNKQRYKITVVYETDPIDIDEMRRAEEDRYNVKLETDSDALQSMIYSLPHGHYNAVLHEHHMQHEIIEKELPLP